MNKKLVAGLALASLALGVAAYNYKPLLMHWAIYDVESDADRLIEEYTGINADLMGQELADGLVPQMKADYTFAEAQGYWLGIAGESGSCSDEAKKFHSALAQYIANSDKQTRDFYQKYMLDVPISQYDIVQMKIVQLAGQLNDVKTKLFMYSCALSRSQGAGK